MRRIALAVTLPVLALGVAACGDQTKDLEKNAQKQLAAAGYPKAKVDCPSDVKTDKGSTFTCKVTGANLTEVTYKVIDGDRHVQVVSSK